MVATISGSLYASFGPGQKTATREVLEKVETALRQAGQEHGFEGEVSLSLATVQESKAGEGHLRVSLARP